MLQINTEVRVVEGCQPGAIPADVLNSSVPLVLKGLAADWPIVSAARNSAQQAADYIRKFDRDIPLTAYVGPPEIKGKVFYNDDFSGFNFNRLNVKLTEVLDRLIGHLDDAEPPTIYVGSTMIDNWLPGFRQENDLNLDDLGPLVSLWVGNRSVISAHYDFPHNIACSVAGRRRFTLFPPEQLDNLYVGPLEQTPSGQSISLVDFNNPDFDRFPRFRIAMDSAQWTELEPGDAIFIPSMWWHHVESLEAFNVLVNYWWRDTPDYLGAPLNVLQHALMGLRDLPLEQRRIWQHIFDYYVFNHDEQDLSHIPEQARGVLAGVDERSAQQIRELLLHRLK